MKISYASHGEGREGVIVMPGWFGDHSVFSPMFHALDGSHFRYAFMDFRGYGASRNEKGNYSIQELAADALALADRLGWSRFHLIGHSMGGLAIQQVMVDARDRVKSAVALTPVPPGGLRLPPEQRQLFEAAIVSDEARRAILDFSTGGRLPDAWLNWMVERCGQLTTREAFGGYLEAFADTDLLAEAAGINTPLLVAVGQHDAALTADLMASTFLKCYPNSRLEVIANSGHYPMQEAPLYTIKLVEDFLREHSE